MALAITSLVVAVVFSSFYACRRVVGRQDHSGAVAQLLMTVQQDLASVFVPVVLDGPAFSLTEGEEGSQLSFACFDSAMRPSMVRYEATPNGRVSRCRVPLSGPVDGRSSEVVFEYQIEHFLIEAGSADQLKKNWQEESLPSMVRVSVQGAEGTQSSFQMFLPIVEKLRGAD